MKVTRVGEMILFEGKRLSAGFALRRPILMHLGWDAFASGRAGANRVSQRRVWFRDLCRGIGGPLLVDLKADCSSYQWTGEVDIQDNRVAYRNVHCARGVRIDAVFHVEPDRLVLELEQQAEADLPVLEFETWRFAWSLHDGMTGVAGVPTLSGNSGTYRWSTNAWDVVGFGHMDAYVNVWTYRALRTATALMGELGDRSRANRCREAADALKANFAAHLVNPETGWVVGWKSRDGQLHDYGYIWINGPACAFGLLEPPAARKALKNLEKLCDKLGLASVRLGLPYNLLPLRSEDHMLVHIWSVHTQPTFEFYTDGAMGPMATAYYLRALSTHGFKARARRIAKETDESFAQGLFTCGAGRGIGTGREFLSWEGLPNGYEGTMANAFTVLLYAIAIEQKLIVPPEPEWWPVH